MSWLTTLAADGGRRDHGTTAAEAERSTDEEGTDWISAIADLRPVTLVVILLV